MDRNDNEFDKEVKERLKEEVNFVPDNINKAFDEALLKVQATKKKRNYKKIAGIVSIFLSAGLFGFSVTPYAKNIHKAFDEALLKVQATKKKRNYKKIAGIVSIFLSAGLFGFSVTPYAKNIPVLRNIYETFNRKTYENYDKYASDINITKESNGVGITINKVIYDGIDLLE